MSDDSERPYLAFGEHLKTARTAAKKSRRVVEEEAGVPSGTLQRYEDGFREAPLSFVQKLVPVYGVTLDFLLAPFGVQQGAAPAQRPTAGTFPVHGTAAEGVLWSAEQMSETVTRLIREARQATGSHGGGK
jgi:transcriptional regulator with XRE-family HTH domain